MQEEKEKPVKNTPILLRIISVIILVVGIVGFLFFAIANIYNLYNPQFLSNLKENNSHFAQLSSYILIQAILYCGVIISSVFINRMKKAGIFIYFSVFVLLMITELVFGSFLLINQIIIGLIGLTLLLYYPRFS